MRSAPPHRPYGYVRYAVADPLDTRPGSRQGAAQGTRHLSDHRHPTPPRRAGRASCFCCRRGGGWGRHVFLAARCLIRYVQRLCKFNGLNMYTSLHIFLNFVPHIVKAHIALRTSLCLSVTSQCATQLTTRSLYASMSECSTDVVCQCRHLLLAKHPLDKREHALAGSRVCCEAKCDARRKCPGRSHGLSLRPNRRTHLCVLDCSQQAV